jgi:hypothetical protein
MVNGEGVSSHSRTVGAAEMVQAMWDFGKFFLTDLGMTYVVAQPFWLVKFWRIFNGLLCEW